MLLKNLSLLCLLLVRITSVYCQSSPLYIIGVPTSTNPEQTGKPAVLLQMDVISNTTVEVMSFDFGNSNSSIISSTFDQDNEIYYFIYIIPQLLNTTTYLSAINVNSKQFVIEEMLFSEDPVLWGIDLDSNSNIHYVRRNSFKPFYSKYVVDYCAFEIDTQTSVQLVGAAALIPGIGSLVYIEANSTVLISNHMLGITSIGLGNYVTQIPPYGAFGYPGILWNKVSNQGYLLSVSATGVTEYYIKVLKYIPLSIQFPEICSILLPLDWKTYTNSDIGSVDPINNLITLVFTQARSENQVNPVNALLTIHLDTCEYTWTIFSNGDEYILIGPEFAY